MPSHEFALGEGAEYLRWSKRVGVQRYMRLLARLSRMTPAEAAARGVQIPLRKLVKSNGPRFGSIGESDEARRHAFAMRCGESTRECLAERLDERFLFGPSFREQLHATGQRDARGAEQIARLADSLSAGGLEILGIRVRVVPGEIDWQADPRSKHGAWSRGQLDEAAAIRSETADVKYVWEVNRQQYLTLLGRAFWQSGDSRYAQQTVALVDDWIARNPVEQGVNWSSHLEVAMRALSWLWTMPYVVAWPDLDDQFLRRWLDSLADHHRHLAANLSIYTDPTNHLLGEATCLWMLSTVFPELPEASAQRVRALDILAREVERQITADGVNIEHATSYHRFVLDFLVQILALARRIGEPLPPVLYDRTRAALAFVAALVGPDGNVPMIGDSDDARGLPLPEMTGWDFRDLLSTGAVLFDEPEWKKLSGGLAESTVWLLGQEGSQTFHRLSGGDAKQKSTIFAGGGYCVFKAETDRFRVDTLFDVGPLGLWPNAAHGHADALSLLIRINDELLLDDPGTGTYFASREVRDRLRRTAAHNTLTIDNLDQADVFDVFKWVNPMRVDLLESFTGEHFDYAVGQHDGYCRLRKAVTHRRHLLFVRPASWVVIDRLDGSGEHLVTRRFHFAPGTCIRQEPSGSLTAVSPKTGAGLRFTFAEFGQPNVSVAWDEQGLWSEQYGRWRCAPRFAIEAREKTPLTLCLFIEAFGGDVDRRSKPSANVAGRLQRVVYGKASLWRRTGAQGEQELVLFNPTAERVTLPDRRVSDASFLFVESAPDRSGERVFLVAERAGRRGRARVVRQEHVGAATELNSQLCVTS